MERITRVSLAPDQAGLWFLGQAGYILRSAGITVTIDAYLSDSVGAAAAEFGRRIPVPLPPETLRTDVFVVTHDHLDHLDPETILRYPKRDTTEWVAPRFAAAKLIALGIPAPRVHQVEAGETWAWQGLVVTGVFALPTGVDVLDTTGYLVTFPNGRNVYHSSDTAFTPLLLKAIPSHAEVSLFPINGKWGNLNVEQAVELAAAMKSRFVMPNHYDMMSLNAENPESFRWFCQQRKLSAQCVIPAVLEPFIWS